MVSVLYICRIRCEECEAQDSIVHKAYYSGYREGDICLVALHKPVATIFLTVCLLFSRAGTEC